MFLRLNSLYAGPQGQKPVKKNRSNKPKRDESPMESLTAFKAAELLAKMPALFNTDLPPCGFEFQVAYERLINILRSRFLASEGQLSVADIVEELQYELEEEAGIRPPGSERMTGRRKPWRREQVFRYELRWAEYFVREAMYITQDSRTGQEQEQYESPVPPELKLQAPAYMLETWAVWVINKRELNQAKKEELKHGWEETGMDLVQGAVNPKTRNDQNASDEKENSIGAMVDNGLVQMSRGESARKDSALSNGGKRPAIRERSLSVEDAVDVDVDDDAWSQPNHE